MTKILSLLFITVLSLTACSTHDVESGTVRYVLHDAYISSWEDDGSKVIVHLNDDGARKLKSTTRYRRGYPLEIYANRTLIKTETIQKFDIRDLELKVSGATKSRLLANLPANKKAS